MSDWVEANLHALWEASVTNPTVEEFEFASGNNGIGVEGKTLVDYAKELQIKRLTREYGEAMDERTLIYPEEERYAEYLNEPNKKEEETLSV